MAKLQCPECDAVLNPSKPPAPGKKVKCPRCKEIFVVPEEERPRAVKKKKVAAPKKKAPAPKPKPAPKKKAIPDDDDESDTPYGFADNMEEEEEEGKPEIDYIPDLEVKNPRGPVMAKMVGPTSWLMGLSALTAILSALSICFWVWPFLFTRYNSTYTPTKVREIFAKEKADAKKRNPNDPAPPPPPVDSGRQINLEDLSDEERARFDELVSEDQKWRTIWACVSLLSLIYHGVVSMGAVKMQGLESYKWSMTSCIMGCLNPFTLGFCIWGLQFLKEEKTQEAFTYVAD